MGYWTHLISTGHFNYNGINIAESINHFLICFSKYKNSILKVNQIPLRAINKTRAETNTKYSDIGLFSRRNNHLFILLWTSWTSSGFRHETCWIGLNPVRMTIPDAYEVTNDAFDCSSIVRDNNEGRAAIEKGLERHHHRDGARVDADFEAEHWQNVVDDYWKKSSHEWNCCLKGSLVNRL